MITDLISILERDGNLSYDQMNVAMKEILGGKISDDSVANFLKNLTKKGETDNELLAMLDNMQEFSLHIEPKCNSTLIDVCGTGGDNMKTFNVSTTASFVVAASGGAVAKHGNRSVSGILGSADIFEYFGYDLDLPPQKVSEIIEKFNIGFMFAQRFHPAMKHVAKARKMVGGRTAFNILGPLTNPANVKNQLIGVFSDEFLERIVNLLKKKGSKTIMTVRSKDGLDELSTTAKNQIYFLKNNKIESMILDPEKIGLRKANIRDIQVTTKNEALSSFVSVLNNTANRSMIETTALNAAGGLMVANIANDFPTAVDIALDTIKSENAYKLFENFVSFCGSKEKLRGVELS